MSAYTEWLEDCPYCDTSCEYEMESLTYGFDHPYTCRCKVCLKWWVNCGLEEVGDNEYRCGPFTIAEFLAAGGHMPERAWAENN